MIKWYDNIPNNPFRANLIRICYCDGIADPTEDPTAHEKLKQYFDSIEKNNFFLDVFTSQAIKLSEGGFRQKGVDVLMAIDALSIANLDHYDSGLFLLADRDFIPLIEAL